MGKLSLPLKLLSLLTVVVTLVPRIAFAQVEQEVSARTSQKREWLARTQALFSEVARSARQNFRLQIDLEGEVDFAKAESDGASLVVTVSKKLLDHPNLSDDGLGMVLCHELGHLFGGAPRRSPPLEWDGPTAADGRLFVSAEGEADYYASAQCFRHLVRGEDHRRALAEKPRDPMLIGQCDRAWGAGSEESLICQRAVLGGLNLLELNFRTGLAVSTPDSTRVPVTIVDQYPSRQCRLDTFVHGALCRSKRPFHFDFEDSSSSECQELEGRRPACWYRAVGSVSQSPAQTGL